jgi:hypothetical protein
VSRESFLDRTNGVPGRSPSHMRSKKQEKELSVRLSATLTPASGAKALKGDLRQKGVVRIEAKTTKNKSFSVTLDMIRKIEEAALPYDEMPVIVIEFNDGNGRKVAEVAVVPMYALDILGASSE